MTTRAEVNADNLSLAAIAAALLLDATSNPQPPLPEEIGLWNEILRSLVQFLGTHHARGLVGSFGCKMKQSRAEGNKQSDDLAQQLLRWIAERPSNPCSIIKTEADGMGKPDKLLQERERGPGCPSDMERIYLQELN